MSAAAERMLPGAEGGKVSAVIGEDGVDSIVAAMPSKYPYEAL